MGSRPNMFTTASSMANTTAPCSSPRTVMDAEPRGSLVRVSNNATLMTRDPSTSPTVPLVICSTPSAPAISARQDWSSHPASWRVCSSVSSSPISRGETTREKRPDLRSS